MLDQLSHLWSLRVVIYGKSQPVNLFSTMSIGCLISSLEYAEQEHQARAKDPSPRTAVGPNRRKGLRLKSEQTLNAPSAVQ